MTAPQFIKALLQQATEEGARSTALKSLGWLLAMFIPATLACFYWHFPDWIRLAASIVTGVIVIVYLGSYIFLLFMDRDALRSERYSLTKLAIEKGVYGDSLTGIIDAKELERPKQIAAETSQQGGDR